MGTTHRQVSCIELNYLLKIQLYQELQNMTLFKNSIFQVELFKRRSTLLGWALNPMTGILQRKQEDKKIQGRRPYDNKGKDWYDATTRQGMQPAKSHEKLRGGKEGISPSTQHCPANTLISMRNHQNCKRIKFYCFSPPCLQWFVTAALQKRIHTFCQINHYHLLRFYHLNNDQKVVWFGGLSK